MYLEFPHSHYFPVSFVSFMSVYGVSVTKMERRNIDQRYAIKFCVKLGESAKETFDEIVKVFGDEAMSRAQVSRWHKEFKNGRENVEG